MKRKPISPSEWIIEQFGGVRQTASVVGRSPASVCYWKKTGRIPANMQMKIMKIAKELNLDITPGDLVGGR